MALLRGCAERVSAPRDFSKIPELLTNQETSSDATKCGCQQLRWASRGAGVLLTPCLPTLQQLLLPTVSVTKNVALAAKVSRVDSLPFRPGGTIFQHSPMKQKVLDANSNLLFHNILERALVISLHLGTIFFHPLSPCPIPKNLSEHQENVRPHRFVCLVCDHS